MIEINQSSPATSVTTISPTSGFTTKKTTLSVSFSNTQNMIQSYLPISSTLFTTSYNDNLICKYGYVLSGKICEGMTK